VVRFSYCPDSIAQPLESRSAFPAMAKSAITGKASSACRGLAGDSAFLMSHRMFDTAHPPIQAVPRIFAVPAYGHMGFSILPTVFPKGSSRFGIQLLRVPLRLGDCAG